MLFLIFWKMMVVKKPLYIDAWKYSILIKSLYLSQIIIFQDPERRVKFTLKNNKFNLYIIYCDINFDTSTVLKSTSKIHWNLDILPNFASKNTCTKKKFFVSYLFYPPPISLKPLTLNLKCLHLKSRYLIDQNMTCL